MMSGYFQILQKRVKYVVGVLSFVAGKILRCNTILWSTRASNKNVKKLNLKIILYNWN